jgi:actin-related protein
MKDTLEYTQEQLDEFQSLLQARLAKSQKKKALKSKKEEKSAQEAAKRAAAAEEAARQKAEAERLHKEQLEHAARMKALHAQRQERLRQHQTELRRVEEHNAKVAVYQEELSKQQKRLKALRKKQRDVVELQEKVAAQKAADKAYKVTAEQQQKLDRLDAIEEEIEEALEAEKGVLTTCPGEMLPVPVWEEDTAVQGGGGAEAMNMKEVGVVIKAVSSEAGAAEPLQRSASCESAFSNTSGTTALEAATVMEVGLRAGKGGDAGHTSIAITEVPMNTKASAAGTVSKAPTLNATSRSSCGSPTTAGNADSGGESQFATPYSFSPLNTSRHVTAEPRRAFWGGSSGASAGTGAAPPATRPAWGSSTAGSASSAVDDGNWRVRKPLPEPEKTASATTLPKQPAWTSASAAAAAATAGNVRSTGAAWGAPSASSTSTATTAATSTSVTGSSGGWSRGNPIAALAAADVNRAIAASAALQNKPAPAPVAPVAAPKPAVAKPAAPAADEWVTLAPSKKKAGKKA